MRVARAGYAAAAALCVLQTLASDVVCDEGGARVRDEVDEFTDERLGLRVVVYGIADAPIAGHLSFGCAAPAERRQGRVDQVVVVSSFTLLPEGLESLQSELGVDLGEMTLRFDKQPARKLRGWGRSRLFIVNANGADTYPPVDLDELLDAAVSANRLILRTDKVSRFDLAQARRCLREFKRRCAEWHEGASISGGMD